jgi:hypothetical protein
LRILLCPTSGATYSAADDSLRKRKRRQQDGLRRMIEASERLGQYELEDEFINARNAVSDAELVAGINAAPDTGGALLVELSEFMQQRGEKS